jgi:hypothetical protein
LIQLLVARLVQIVPRTECFDSYQRTMGIEGRAAAADKTDLKGSLCGGTLKICVLVHAKVCKYSCALFCQKIK